MILFYIPNNDFKSFRIKATNWLSLHFLQCLAWVWEKSVHFPVNYGEWIACKHACMSEFLFLWLHSNMAFIRFFWHFSLLSDFLLDNYCTNDFSLSQPQFKKSNLESRVTVFYRNIFPFLRKTQLLTLFHVFLRICPLSLIKMIEKHLENTKCHINANWGNNKTVIITVCC